MLGIPVASSRESETTPISGKMAANCQDEDEEKEEELDYMSDLFITEITKIKSKGTARPTRPSAPKRLQKRMKGKKSSSKTLTKTTKLEQQAREEGLATPIPVENKGYSLLCKMGYVEGESLGKSGSNGRVDPVSVTIKGDRFGLGRDEFVREKQEKEEELKERRLFDFRRHCLSQSAQRKLRSDLKKSRQTCEHLDTANGHSAPIAGWYWLSTSVLDEGREGVGEEESSEEAPPCDEEQLEILTEYLRAEYYYCLWCGSEYTSKEQLSSECPGSEWEDHQS